MRAKTNLPVLKSLFSEECHPSQGCAEWGTWWGRRALQCFKFQESWSKGSHAARELATAFSVTFSLF